MSNIKGGGRAVLTSETQDSLIDLLLDLRGPSTNTTNTSADVSQQNRALARKRFLQKLVKRHEKKKLSEKYNRSSTEASSSASSLVGAVTSHPPSATATGKVRIELVEAVYSNSSNSNTNASKKKNPWKAGSVRKTLVLPRSTRVIEKGFLKQAKNKLRIKSMPCRCFCLGPKDVQIELEGDLSGVPDGTTVYVTTLANRTVKIATETAEKEDAENDENDDDDDEDPLDAVKQAYASQKREYPRARPVDPNVKITADSLSPLSDERSALPAAEYRVQFLQAVSQHRIVLVSGATGCGKSTQIPQYLRQGGAQQVLVTQPRRVAATSLARRVAHECISTPPGTPGSLVGYQVRLDRAVADTARIVYCTVGILLRMLLSGDTLQHLSVLVIDEVHERDVNTDFLLTLLRSVLQRNQQLRVVLMSATAATGLFVNYFAAYKPAVLTIPGRTFPIQMRWLGECERMAKSTLVTSTRKAWKNEAVSDGDRPILSPRAAEKIDSAFVTKLIEGIVREQQSSGEIHSKGQRSSGAILVFMPGKAEIEAMARALYDSSFLGDRELCDILKLHSAIPNAEQRKVFSCASSGTVKIVLATNIAETSITIPDVSHVIDTGRVKESRFNAATRIRELVTVWTSQASAQQRAGRAGRTTSGNCWRLYTEQFFTSLPKQTTPEMVRTPLDELVLQMCLLFEHRRGATQSQGVSPIKFLSNAPEPPANSCLENACEHLLEVGALATVSSSVGEDPLYRLTPLGYHLSRLPMDAKVGKVLIVGCILELVDSALTIAAALSCTKSCFLPSWGSNQDRQVAVEKRNRLIGDGFGGRNWKGGTVKGDLIAVIAVHRAWTRQRTGKRRTIFCRDHALDQTAMNEIHSLRSQFRDCLVDGGFLGKEGSYDAHRDDALLTSCCLVAGLYPNIATLMRPRNGGLRGGRLITRDGDICRPSSSSFQTHRVNNALETGKDAYAVFHAKHRSITTEDKRKPQVFLSEVNFVSRYALLLFGGSLQLEKNAIIVDGWLKFKVGDKDQAGCAVLILELRKEVDNIILRHMEAENNERVKEECRELIAVVRKLLTEESSP